MWRRKPLSLLLSGRSAESLLASFTVMIHAHLRDMTLLTLCECWQQEFLDEELELLGSISLGWLVKEASPPQGTAGGTLITMDHDLRKRPCNLELLVSGSVSKGPTNRDESASPSLASHAL